jgi:hypothetical protein
MSRFKWTKTHEGSGVGTMAHAVKANRSRLFCTCMNQDGIG